MGVSITFPLFLLFFFSSFARRRRHGFSSIVRISRPSSFFIRIKTGEFIPVLLKSCLIQPSAIVCRASPYIMKQKAAVKIQDVVMLSSSSPHHSRYICACVRNAPARLPTRRCHAPSARGVLIQSVNKTSPFTTPVCD